MSAEIDTTPSEAQLIELLSALAACDGSTRLAVRRLSEAGVDINAGRLKLLRQQHGGMYLAIAQERSTAQEEAITQEFRELTVGAQRFTRAYLDDLAGRMEDDQLTDAEKRGLPQIIQATTKVMQVSTDKFLALTGRPTDGKIGDNSEAAATLVRLGVLVPRERPEIEESIPGEAEEVPPG